ncbi:MAG: hypothetical protein KGO49_09285 [Gammaproteobacteria bacterium]|nr:hypothetical protein [Gammaproteobacteria bacterium]
MIKQMIVVVSIAALTVSACSSKKDANEKNFKVAIQQQLDKTSTDLCIPFSSTKDVQLNSWDIKQLQPFEAAGLISGTEVEVAVHSLVMSSTVPPIITKAKRYTLTAEGKKFYQETDAQTEPRIGYPTAMHYKTGSLCYGKVAVDQIVKWTEPQQNGGVQVALVTYLYKIDNLANWAKNPDIQNVSPTLKQMVEGASKTELMQEVMLTNVGWEVVPH